MNNLYKRKKSVSIKGKRITKNWIVENAYLTYRNGFPEYKVEINRLVLDISIMVDGDIEVKLGDNNLIRLY